MVIKIKEAEEKEKHIENFIENVATLDFTSSAISILFSHTSFT